MVRTPRLGLAQRLYLFSSALVAALVGLAVVVWLLLSGQTRDAREVVDERVPQQARIAALEIDVIHASLQLRHAMLARDEAEQRQALADIARRTAQLDRTLAEFGRAMTSPEGQRAFAPLPALLADFKRVAGENVALVLAGRHDEAFAFLVEKTVPARNALLEPLFAERRRQHERLDAEVTAIRDHATHTRNLVLGIVLLVSAGLAVFALRIVAVMRQLGAEPDELRRAAEAVAAGDLAQRFTLRSGDRASVMAALQRMAATLSRTVQAVRDNAERVASASAQIASGNADLAARTESQAASLQLTSSSMEQLGATVGTNDDHSRQAHQLASSASGIATRGGELVQQVVATMARIDESSRRIAEIIGTIDGIAFRTNILALNAAVEAARAGEQGRGFAVVAAEVRALAQRSAEAAREIKALIGASVERVGQGSELVDRTGRTMHDIVLGIRRVSDIVGEISEASARQRAGVQQVGQAVSQMDEATQRNAALVQQSAAAADSLRQQASQLVQAMAVFRLA